MANMKEVLYTQRARSVLSILDSASIQGHSDLVEALAELDRKIHEPETNVAEVARDICSVPHMFEVVLSGLEERAVEKVVRALKNAFPGTDVDRYRSSLSKRLLQRLAAFFSSLNAYPDDSTRRSCQQVSRQIPQLHRSLDVLSNGEVLEDSTAHEAVLKLLGLLPPRSERETRFALMGLLKALKSHLDYFLGLLTSNRRLGEIIRSQFFEKRQVDRTLEAESQAGQARQGNASVALHTFSGKKTALVINAIEGFGDRRILMSSRTIRDLKKARMRPSLYSGILRVLRSLSGGGSEGVTETLLAVSNLVEVYAVKVHRDFAVVYRRDQSPSLYDEGMEDVIRVFGIFNTSALEDGFWQVFAEQVSLRQAEALGSHASSQFATRAKQVTSEQYADKIRSLLVISKFVDLSQTALEAIQNDEEIHQVFELSLQEKEVLNYNGSCYVVGRSGTGKTTIMVTKILASECTFFQYPDMMESKPRQIFVTRSHTLAYKVKETFKGMYQTHVLGISSSDAAEKTQRLVNVDEEERRKRKRFGELNDDDFPLFVSFDYLCSLIEEELRFACPAWTGPPRADQISFDVFSRLYWPKLDTSALSGIDPTLVFGQLIGVIEGSEESLSSPGGHISRERYVNMGRPKAVTHLQDRERVYDVFEKYRRLKAENHQHDIADRTHAILRGLDKSPSSLRGVIDFLFVDEAQDNLLVDTRLLRLLCNNPDGLFWAGDTAQAIFAGSAFTFNELKSFMWRIEDEISHDHEASNGPQYFELITNFRSAQGILACGQTLLDCISMLWPETIDKLPREVGHSKGAKPLMFVQKNCEKHLLRLLLERARAKKGTVEFGAEQCIIVRNDAARIEALKATEGALDDTSQILTIYQSKGLEYDDVIIYNFFEDSHCELSQWRHLLSQCTSADLYGLPSFEADTKFDAIARELKSLYVACTRARHNLWVIDTSEKAEIMKRIWEKNDEIDWQECAPDIHLFASASTKAMWRNKGYEYFGRGYYDLARKAYRNAGLPHDAAVASAYLLRENAETLYSSAVQVVDRGGRSHAYREAANAFDEVAPGANGEDRLAYYRIAAECFLQIPDEARAAVAFENARDYNQAIKLHRGVGNFQQIIQLLCEMKDALKPDTLLKVQYASQLFCLLRVPIALSDALAVFSDGTEITRFASRHGLDSAQVAVLEHEDDLLQAARHRLQMDQPVAALSLLRRCCSHSKDSIAVLLTEVLSACWRNATLATLDWEDKLSQKTKKTEALGMILADAGWEPYNSSREIERSMFRAIFNEDLPSLRRLAFSPYSRKSYAALLCLSRVILPPTSCHGKDDTDILRWLEDFLPMARLLGSLCAQKDPFHSSSVQRLLGFRTVTPTVFRLLPGSAIEKHAIARKTPFMETGEAATRHGHLISKDVLRSLLDNCLSGSLGRRVLEAVSTLRSEVRLKTGTKGKANPIATSLPAVVGSLLHMALILDQALKVVPSDALQKEQRRLVQDIYRVLTSPARNEGLHLSLGSVLDLRERDIQDGIQTILTWIRGTVLPTPDVLSSPGRVTDLMKAFLLVYALRDATRNSYCSLHTCTQGRSLYLSGNSELDNIQESVLDMFSGCKPWSPQPLLCLLSTVVVSRLPVNIEVLMSTIDFVAGWLALLYTQSIAGNVVGTVLSKRGLLVYGHGISAPNVKSDIYMEYSRWLVIILAPILPELLNPRQGRDAFIYSKQAPLRSTAEDRHVYISRVCEAMVLLGHNIPVRDLREDILIAITSLQNKAKQFPKINKGYVGAKTWADLTAALPSALPLVALVQTSTLSSTGNRAAYRAVRSALPLVERRISAVPSISKRPITIVQRRSALTSSTPAKVARNTPELRAVQRLSSALNSEIESQHRLFAAIRIQDFYRRTVSLHRPITYGNLAFLVSGAFAECISQVNRITWDDRRYRMVFLGTVPHVLACLDAMIMQFEYLKSVAVQRLKNCHHSKLEELGHAVTAIHDDMQATRVLRSDKLGPTTYVYRLQRWKEFRDCVREIPKLIEKLPANVTRDIRAEWSIVRKAVFQPGKKDLDWADARAGGMTGWPSANECKT